MSKKIKWVENLQELELEKTYSQFGEETLIEEIFANIGTTSKFILDIGAGGLGVNMSNTRKLIETGEWGYLGLDGDPAGNDYVVQALVTRENIISILEEHNVPENIDLLSIDIDGNDFYILQEILAAGYRPRVIIMEYNGCIAVDESKTIKYSPDFVHGGDDYYGVSFKLNKDFLESERYSFVCVTETNQFFIDSEIVPQADYELSYVPQQYFPAGNSEWEHFEF